MIGILINSFRGIKTNNDLKKRLAESEQKLDGINSFDELLTRIDEPYNRVIAKNQFLLAEYYQKREKNISIAEIKTLWEKVKKEMAANIQQTEQQLLEVSATKLDIARIVASLAQLTNEFDQELLTSKNVLEKEAAALKARAANHDAVLSEALQQISYVINKVTTDLQQTTAKQQQAMQYLEKRITAVLSDVQQGFYAKTDELLQKVNAVSNDITLLEQSLDARIQKLQQKLHRQKSEWSARADIIDATILAHANANKKSLIQWTVPLYVIVAGIMAKLFLF